MHIVCQDGSKIQKISFLLSVGTPFFKKKKQKNKQIRLSYILLQFLVLTHSVKDQPNPIRTIKTIPRFLIF